MISQPPPNPMSLSNPLPLKHTHNCYLNSTHIMDIRKFSTISRVVELRNVRVRLSDTVMLTRFLPDTMALPNSLQPKKDKTHNCNPNTSKISNIRKIRTVNMIISWSLRMCKLGLRHFLSKYLKKLELPIPTLVPRQKLPTNVLQTGTLN